MQAVKTIGLDIAKSSFQVHGVDADGQVVFRRQLKRRYVLAFFQKVPSCLVGMEACATSHHWYYGQRSCEPRKQAEHMAAPTNAAHVQESPLPTRSRPHMGVKRTSLVTVVMSAFDPKRTLTCGIFRSPLDRVVLGLSYSKDGP